MHSTPYQQDISGTTIRSSDGDAARNQERPDSTVPEAPAGGDDNRDDADESSGQGQHDPDMSLGQEMAGIAKSLQGNDTLIKRVARARADARMHDTILQTDENEDPQNAAKSPMKSRQNSVDTSLWKSGPQPDTTQMSRQPSTRSLLQDSTRGNIQPSEGLVPRSNLSVQYHDEDYEASPSVAARRSRPPSQPGQSSRSVQTSMLDMYSRSVGEAREASRPVLLDDKTDAIDQDVVDQIGPDDATDDTASLLEQITALKQQLSARDKELSHLQERNAYLENSLEQHFGRESPLTADHPAVGHDKYAQHRLGYVDNMSCTQARNLIKEAAMLFETPSYDLMRTLRIAHRTLHQENFYENFSNGVHKVLYGSAFTQPDASGKRYRACLGRMLLTINELKGNDKMAHGS